MVRRRGNPPGRPAFPLIVTVQTLEIILLALALSIDAFAVSLAAAATGRITDQRSVFRLAFHFGLFQFLLPVMGWAAGAFVEQYLASIDHWVAFALLSFVGIRMLRVGRNPGETVIADDPSRGIALMMLSTAVSIDALAVGLILGMLHTDILLTSLLIGLITGTVSLAGIALGRTLQARVGSVAERIGGLILLAIAIRVLVAHIS